MPGCGDRISQACEQQCMAEADITFKNFPLLNQFPRPKQYKLSDIVAASSLPLQLSFLSIHVKTDKFSTLPVIFHSLLLFFILLAFK